MTIHAVLARLGVSQPFLGVATAAAFRAGNGLALSPRSPIDGTRLAPFVMASVEDTRDVIQEASDAFRTWREVPAPARGELVRQFGDALRRHKEDLAAVVSWEAGKITQEALGEVQEMIDICDFAVGLSRQLYGKTIATERRQHRLTELWHPLGPVGVISAFNFPVAVWAWNAALALVCGDPVVWKPSEKTPLTALACHAILMKVIQSVGGIPAGVSCLVIGDAEVGQALATSPALGLVSATGSVRMGRSVAQTVAQRLGRSLLELGGNNAMVVTPSADMDLALRAILFGAVGTCGQRCTSLRRLIVHQDVASELLRRLRTAYSSLPIGDPTAPGVLVGPLIDEHAFDAMQWALTEARRQGGVVHGGERVTGTVPSGGVYVQPALVEIAKGAAIVRQETFAPILYVMRYQTLAEAIDINNDVPQGLASAVFTTDMREAELFCSPVGSDCGIINVNIGTSGAEIGGAFGGEKDTGGGRESGSDAWKSYMRRVTNTVNFSRDLPLAQGIRFDIERG